MQRRIDFSFVFLVKLVDLFSTAQSFFLIKKENIYSIEISQKNRNLMLSYNEENIKITPPCIWELAHLFVFFFLQFKYELAYELIKKLYHKLKLWLFYLNFLIFFKWKGNFFKLKKKKEKGKKGLQASQIWILIPSSNTLKSSQRGNKRVVSCQLISTTPIFF